MLYPTTNGAVTSRSEWSQLFVTRLRLKPLTARLGAGSLGVLSPSFEDQRSCRFLVNAGQNRRARQRSQRHVSGDLQACVTRRDRPLAWRCVFPSTLREACGRAPARHDEQPARDHLTVHQAGCKVLFRKDSTTPSSTSEERVNRWRGLRDVQRSTR